MSTNPDVALGEQISGTVSFQIKKEHLEGMPITHEMLTCANHADEEIILDDVGWNHFICPKCGHDYSIGRKIATLKHPLLRSFSYRDPALKHGRYSERCR